MKLSGTELFLALIIVVTGLTGNLKLFLNQKEKIMQIKWSISMYGIALLIVICGVFTPPDILSNIIFSGPLAIAYILILKQLVFKKHDVTYLK